jgi:hypothetical protein
MPGARHPHTSNPRVPSLQQEGAGQGHHHLRILFHQQCKFHKFCGRQLRGSSPVYLSAVPRQRLKHTALPPSGQEVMFTVSPP